jgi:hypothetical protein
MNSSCFDSRREAEQKWRGERGDITGLIVCALFTIKAADWLSGRFASTSRKNHFNIPYKKRDFSWIT